MTPEEQIAHKKELEDVLFHNPKSLVTGTRIYITDEYFALRLDVGTQQFNFALPPRAAKVLSYFLSEQVKNFENGIRKIEVKLPEPTPETMNEVKAPIGFEAPESSDSGVPQVLDIVVKPETSSK
jgi:hypothetical protein